MTKNVHLEHLVLAPFRDTVEKAKTALENAEAAGDDGDAARAMQRAAKGLLSKSERALKKIEPLCDRFLQEYGTNFVDAVKESSKAFSFSPHYRWHSLLVSANGMGQARSRSIGSSLTTCSGISTTTPRLTVSKRKLMTNCRRC